MLSDANGLTYNANLNILTVAGSVAANVTGNLTGNADTATNATLAASATKLAGAQNIVNTCGPVRAANISYDGQAAVELQSTIANDAITNAMLANDVITLGDGGSNSTEIALGGQINVIGTAGEINVAESSGTIQVGLPDNVTIAGNLTVEGTTTTIDSTTVTIEDKQTQLASNVDTAVTGGNPQTTIDTNLNNSGIILGSTDNLASPYKSFVWNNAAQAWSSDSTSGLKAGSGVVTLGDDTATLTVNATNDTMTFGAGIDILDGEDRVQLKNFLIDGVTIDGGSI